MKILGEEMIVSDLASKLESALEEARDGKNIPYASKLMAEAIVKTIAKIELEPGRVAHV